VETWPGHALKACRGTVFGIMATLFKIYNTGTDVRALAALARVFANGQAIRMG